MSEAITEHGTVEEPVVESAAEAVSDEPATPTYWQPNAANAPGSAARRASAGAGGHSKPHDEAVPDHDALTTSAGIPG
ncbi:hypothetical protein [Streptomyces alanosinicus]|uniref:Uncharacterized protein n=1 Tax=Streptomyces alanosinicus TaxID=68171 RepID=A0A918YTL0_9ACTN|nr:hypothetical protein GCM10010339_86780 [Streptomyces alanosinicus]